VWDQRLPDTAEARREESERTDTPCCRLLRVAYGFDQDDFATHKSQPTGWTHHSSVSCWIYGGLSRLCIQYGQTVHVLPIASGTGILATELIIVISALHPSGVTKSSTSFGWGKGGNVTSAGWQVTLCGTRVPVAVRQLCELLYTCYLLTYIVWLTSHLTRQWADPWWPTWPVTHDPRIMILARVCVH